MMFICLHGLYCEINKYFTIVTYDIVYICVLFMIKAHRINTQYLFILIIFFFISREAGNNVQYIWSYYSVAELKKMMDAFDAWEGKGTVQFFYDMETG